MFKLVTNRKFMRGVKRVMEELKAAGLKLNSDVCSPRLVAHSDDADVVFPQDALQEIMGLTQENPKKDS